MASLLSKLRDYLRGEQPRQLRNKPGGLAYIRVPAGAGNESLNNCIVTTVRLNEIGTWDIEPHLRYVQKHDAITRSGLVLRAGARVTATGCEDEFLEPIRNPGEDERDESLRYLPAVPPTLIPLRVKGTVS